MAERYTLGPNSLVVEGDTLFLTSVGPFELAAAQQYSQVAERVIREHGAVYFVTDLRAAALMPAETRRYFAQWATRFTAKAVIYYGASLPLRAVATLLLSAARLGATTSVHLSCLCRQSKRLAPHWQSLSAARFRAAVTPRARYERKRQRA